MTMLRPENTKSGRLLFSPSGLLQTRTSLGNASIATCSLIYLRAPALGELAGKQGIRARGRDESLLTAPGASKNARTSESV